MGLADPSPRERVCFQLERWKCVIGGGWFLHVKLEGQPLRRGGHIASEAWGESSGSGDERMP